MFVYDMSHQHLLHGYDTNDVLNAAIEDLAGCAGDGTLRENWYEYTTTIDDDDDVEQDEQQEIQYWWNDETGDVTYAIPTKQLEIHV